MAARAERLGDRGPSAPEHWEPGLGTGEAHVLITVYAIDNEHLDERREVLRQFGQAHGATTVINETRAEALPGGKDHFGFFDGIAQPAVAGSGVEARPGDGQPDGAGGWRDVCTGEFLHGHIDEDGGLPDAPAAPFHCNGTFEVYRKLAHRRRGLPRLHGGEGPRLPGRARHARGQDRRALERRDAARALPRAARPRRRRRPAAHQRLLLRRRRRAVCAARWAPTSAAPTRATPRASSRAG